MKTYRKFLHMFFGMLFYTSCIHHDAGVVRLLRNKANAGTVKIA